MNKSLANRKPKACTAMLSSHWRIKLRERLKQTIDLIRSYANSRILDGKLQYIFIFIFTCDRNKEVNTTLFGEFHCVRNQLNQHLPKSSHIPIQNSGDILLYDTHKLEILIACVHNKHTDYILNCSA
ncbi:hypothetical protein D3C78_1113930 [compost metagenome]